MNDPQTWTTAWELIAGVGDGIGRRGQKGKNWGKCHRIIRND